MSEERKLTAESCRLYIDLDGKVKAACQDRESAESLARQLETDPIVISVEPARPVLEQE